MDIRRTLAVFAGRSVLRISKSLGLGAGATWPGEVTLIIDKKIVSKLIPTCAKIVVVAGTNGKTTTSKMIHSILSQDKEIRIVQNKTGANLLNGVASVLLSTRVSEKEAAKTIFVFEVDEGALPQILRQIKPTVLVLMNLFRDQLDRYGEVDSIAKKWLTALKDKENIDLVVNGDDPHLAWISKNLKLNVYPFGIGDNGLFLEKMQHAVDSTFCPNCGNKLSYSGVYFSHLGEYRCLKCHFLHPKNEVSSHDWESPLAGTYNLYNTMAAGLACKLLGSSETQITKGLKIFTPAFGRSETITSHGKNIKILLSKNPTGFNESLRAFLSAGLENQLLVVLNDRIPDGRDISWIWDVDFEVLNELRGSIFISGDRVWDLGLRLKYALEGKTYYPEEDLGEAIKQATSKLEKNQTLWILPTYSAMLEVRKILLGRKIL